LCDVIFKTQKLVNLLVKIKVRKMYRTGDEERTAILELSNNSPIIFRFVPLFNCSTLKQKQPEAGSQNPLSF